MTRSSGDENRLVEASDDVVSSTTADLVDPMRALDGWLQGLQRSFIDLRPAVPPVLKDDHPLAREIRDIHDLMQGSPGRWAERWRRLQPAHDLASSFESRVMLLVFGKFNAGKSSLCNLLAERFRAHGRAVSYFHLAEGRIVQAEEPLREGATETTSRLQGVCLGEGLVLLDTPGLHSMTPDNAELTLRFTDSADAMLWLSSSTSPGQVQELEELGRELHRNKPLLPVITRSDVFEEDEVDGEIVKRLRNKAPPNRQLQEADVRERALDKLAQMAVPASVLRPPVSISVRAARDAGLTAAALQESGLDRLYAAIVRLIEPAMDYKRRKPVEVLLHHLEETVLGSMASDIMPRLSSQADHLAAEQERLSALKARLASLAWRQIGSGIPSALEGHESVDQLPHVCEALEGLLRGTLDRLVSEHLVDYHHLRMADAATPELRLNPDMALGLDYQQVHDELQAALRQLVSQQLDRTFAPLLESLDHLVRCNQSLQSELGRQGAELGRLKQGLREPKPAAMAAD